MQDLDELIEKKRIIYNQILEELEKLASNGLNIHNTIHFGGYIDNLNNITYIETLENRIKKMQNNKMTLADAATNSFNRIKKLSN